MAHPRAATVDGRQLPQRRRCRRTERGRQRGRHRYHARCRRPAIRLRMAAPALLRPSLPGSLEPRRSRRRCSTWPASPAASRSPSAAAASRPSRSGWKAPTARSTSSGPSTRTRSARCRRRSAPPPRPTSSATRPAPAIRWGLCSRRRSSRPPASCTRRRRLFMLPKNEPRLGEFAEGVRRDARHDRGASRGRRGRRSSRARARSSAPPSCSRRWRTVPTTGWTRRAFLTARLVDIFIGDWDRHADQWRWARFGDDKPHLWRPIPRDRDQAFVRYDGLLLKVARASTPQLVNFGGDYAGMLGQTWNGRDLDRRLPGPAGAGRCSIRSPPRSSRSSPTRCIESAAAQLPRGYVPLDSARLAKALKHRRDRLPEAARDYYRHLAGEVDVHGHRPRRDRRSAPGRWPVHRGVARRGGRRRGWRALLPAPVRPRRHQGESGCTCTTGPTRCGCTGKAGGGIRVRVLPGKGTDQVVDSSGGGRVTMYTEEAGDVVLPGRDVGRGPPALRPARHRLARLGRPLALGHLARRRPRHRHLRRHRCLPHPLRVPPRSLRRALPAAGRLVHRRQHRPGRFQRHLDSPELAGPRPPARASVGHRRAAVPRVRQRGERGRGRDDFFRVDQVDFTLVPSLSFPVGSECGVHARAKASLSPTTDFEDDRFITPGTYGAGTFGLFGGDRRASPRRPGTSPWARREASP